MNLSNFRFFFGAKSIERFLFRYCPFAPPLLSTATMMNNRPALAPLPNGSTRLSMAPPIRKSLGPPAPSGANNSGASMGGGGGGRISNGLMRQSSIGSTQRQSSIGSTLSGMV